MVIMTTANIKIMGLPLATGLMEMNFKFAGHTIMLVSGPIMAPKKQMAYNIKDWPDSTNAGF